MKFMVPRVGPKPARKAAVFRKKAGFSPDRPVIEVRGRCGDCETQ